MIDRPRFKPNFVVEVLAPDKVFLLSESGYFTLDAHSAAVIAPLIDGKRTAQEVVRAAVADGISTTQAYYILALLDKRGYLEAANDELPESVAAFWNSHGVVTNDAVAALNAVSVAVMTFGDVDAAAFVDQLEAVGVRVTDDRKAGDRVVVLVDDYLRPGLDDVNRDALADGTPWLIVKPNGLLSWVGPLFVPGESACWECLRQRLEANRDVDMFLQVMSGSKEPFPVRPALASTACVAYGLAATEVAKWVVLGHSESLHDTVVTIHHTSIETKRHHVVRRPQCPCCGDATLQAALPGPVEFRPSIKTFVSDGGHRSSTPHDALRRLEHHVSPITGIVNELIRITDLDDSLQHVYVSGANLAVRNYSYQNLKRTLRSKSCGKGVTDDQARMSAIGEAIERYSGAFRGDESRLTASFRDLADRAIDPRLVMQFSERQYREREEWNARESMFNNVPLPFDEGAQMEWSPVWSMTEQRLKYLPTGYCYYSYPVSFEDHYVVPDSNGAAAGSTPEEAMLQGFLEVVERDSVAMWWYPMARRPEVDIDSFELSYASDLRDHHRSIGRRLWVLDLTADLGIPAFIALSGRLDDARQEIVFAPAAHLDPDIALLRALTELTQMVPAVLDLDEAGEYKYDDAECVEWWKTATVENQPYLLPSADPAVKRSDFVQSWSDDIATDLEWCQARVEEMGYEMLIHDQTRPDTGLPVLKVIVPGFRHFWARFAPGRLFDVPPRLGWVEGELTENDMNPIPIFI